MSFAAATVNFQAAQVRLLEAATLAALETAINAFLAGAGTPASNDKWRLVSVEVRYAAGAGNPYLGIITYTGS